MNQEDEAARCEGIVVPIVTPIRADGSLDEPALRRVIEHAIRGGVHGIFALGTTGEMPSLSRAMRSEVVRIAAEAVARRVPLYAGITDTSLDETAANFERYRTLGADYGIALPPFYYPIGESEILRHFERLAERTGGPLFIYDYPAMTKVPVPLSVIEQLSQDGRFIGYKDSRGDAISLWRLLERLEGRDFAVFVGPETLLAEAVLWGAAGGVCGGANVCPDLLVQVYDAARARDLDALDLLRRRLIEMGAIYQVGAGGSPVVTGIKAALECLGICERHVLPPLIAFDDEQVEKVRAVLMGIGAFSPLSVD